MTTQAIPHDLSTLSTSELFERATTALHTGAFATALALADEMCRPSRAGTCADLLVPARLWPAMRGYSAEQLQGLEDRIAQYNGYAAR